MTDKQAPPPLLDLAQKAQFIIDSAARLEAVSDGAAAIKIVAMRAKEYIDVHIKAQNALFEALLKASEAQTMADNERRNSAQGVDAAFFNISRALTCLADDLQRRQSFEATRTPGDFR